jgi:carboxyl-terminal processing protease
VTLALGRLLRDLDPHSEYDPDSDWGCVLLAPSAGIGAQLEEDSVTSLTRVVKPIKDGPAYRAGVRSGDLISAATVEEDADGRRRPWTTFLRGEPLAQVEQLLRGRPGSRVFLTVQRPGTDKELTFEVTRNRAVPETVLGVRRRPDDTWDHLADPLAGIGYVRLTSFANDTSLDLARVIEDLEKHGMKGLILDLRFNGGGLIQSATETADLFIDDGVIVTLRGPRHEIPIKGKHEGSHLGFPMICLINGDAEGSSAIVAACLQDHARAVLVGEPIRGGASVQGIFGVGRAELKFTTGVFVRPSGKKLDRVRVPGCRNDEWGVNPEKEGLLVLSAEERAELVKHLAGLETIPPRDRPAKEGKSVFRDRQLEHALEHLRRGLRK